jgi:hypothetical protein
VPITVLYGHKCSTSSNHLIPLIVVRGRLEAVSALSRVLTRALWPEILIGVLLCIPTVSDFIAGGHQSLFGTIGFAFAFLWAVWTLVSIWKRATPGGEEDLWPTFLIVQLSYICLAAAFSLSATLLGLPPGMGGGPVNERFWYLFSLFFSPVSWLFIS